MAGAICVKSKYFVYLGRQVLYCRDASGNQTEGTISTQGVAEGANCLRGSTDTLIETIEHAVPMIYTHNSMSYLHENYDFHSPPLAVLNISHFRRSLRDSSRLI